MNPGIATRVLSFSAQTERNALLDAAPVLARLREAGWSEASRLWAKSPTSYGDVWVKGWLWANASAGGSLTITMVQDPQAVHLPTLRGLALTYGAVDAVVAFASTLWGRIPFGSVVLDQGVAGVVAEGALPEASLKALALIPARVRLEVERTHALELRLAFAPELAGGQTG